MFCNKCGRELVKESGFCHYCGEKQPCSTDVNEQESVSHPMPLETGDVSTKGASRNSKDRCLLFGAGGTAIGAILLAVILLVAGIFSSAGKIEGTGFTTPEDAAKAYLTGLKGRDIDAMLATFAVETYVDHYDFEGMVERLRTYSLSFELRFPNTNEYTRDMNIEGRRNGIVNQILIQYMFYNFPEAINNGTPVTFADAGVLDFVEEFERSNENYIFEDLNVMAAMSAEDLMNASNMRDFLADLPDAPRDLLEGQLTSLLDIYIREDNQQNIEKQATIFGADIEDVANVVVVFEAEGHMWMFCPQAVQYNGRWYLQMLQGNVGNLAGIPVFAGGLIPLD